MNHSEASDFLRNIESKINVSNINYKDHNLWPPLRNRLSASLVKKNIKNKKNSNFILLSSFFKSMFYLFVSKPKFSDVLLVSDKTYCIELNDISYDRVLFGVANKHQKLGDSVDKIFLDELTCEFNKITYVSAFLFKTRIYASLIAYAVFIKRILSLNFTSTNSILDIEKYIGILIKECKKNNICISSKDLIVSSLSVYFHAMLIKKYLKKFDNLKIYQSNSFDPIGSAINLAANSLEIDTFSVQHGGQSENNPFFALWKNSHPNAKLFFSKSYLCWDKVSSEAIKSWDLKDFTPAIKITGYEWIKAIRNNNIISKQKEELVLKSESFFNIIYTLQPSYKLDESFLLALSELHPSVRIWLRSHPADRSLNNHRYNHLSSESIITSLSNQVLLIELFSIADIHITASSSSVFEADSCNVITLFLNSNGETYFPEMIEKGAAKYIISETDFFNYILDKISN
jgi:hypothetical protein